MEWATGKWTALERPAGNVRVMVSADWFPGRRYRDILLRDPEAVYGDLLPLLRGADLRIVNLECALTESGDSPLVKSGPNLSGPTEAVAALRAASFDLACLANNHIMDYGTAGLETTLGALRKAGIRSVGAGRTRAEALAPALLSAGGVTVGVVNFCEGEDCTGAYAGPGVLGWELETVSALVRETRQKADIVLVIFHGGREHVPVPPPYVVRALRLLADAGADAVVAHHPHVPQGMEIYRGKPIVYSLGNFVFDQNTDLFYRRTGYMVELTLGAKGVSGLQLHPYLLGPVHLERLPAASRGRFFEKLKEASSFICEPDRLESAWAAVADHEGTDFLRTLSERMDRAAGDVRSAASARNCLHTPAHRELLIYTLSCICGAVRAVPGPEAEAILKEWLTVRQEQGI